MLTTGDCPHEIQIQHTVGANAFGAPVLGAAETLHAAVEPSRKRVADAQGNDVVCSMALVIPGAPSVEVGDIVTFGGRTYEVVDVQPCYAGRRQTHAEVQLRSKAV